MGAHLRDADDQRIVSEQPVCLPNTDPLLLPAYLCHR